VTLPSLPCPAEAHPALAALLALAGVEAALENGAFAQPVRAGALLDQAEAARAAVPEGLTEAERALLRVLRAAKGAVVPNADLLAALGYRADLETHTLATHIWRLRQKLGESAVQTAPGGYRLGTYATSP
jgi:DNA-binding response OmpR family regulator